MGATTATSSSFDPQQENDVASLLLDHGYLYVSFSARQNENTSQYYGWMLRYSAADLTYAGAFNAAPHAWEWTSPGNPAYVPKTADAGACYWPSGLAPTAAATRGRAVASGVADTPPGRLKPWAPATDWASPGLDLSAMACTGEGGGIWQGGAGPAADRAGNVYVLVGNAHYDPREDSYGDSVVRLHSKPGGGSAPADFGVDGSWAPANEVQADEKYDVDLGSAGPLIVDGDRGPKRIVLGGKTGIFYVLDSSLPPPAAARTAVRAPVQWLVAGTNYRAFDPIGDLRYRTWNYGPHLHGSPTLWRLSDRKAYVYEWAEKDFLKKYEFDPSRGTFKVADPIWHPWVKQETTILAAPCVKAVLCINAMPGGMLAVSANGADESSGIVWAILRAPSIAQQDSIYAFRASDLTELWHDAIGAVPHFAGPTVADGHVFVPTNSMQWRFSIYSLGAANVTTPAKRVPPPALKKALEALAGAQTMPMSSASHRSKVPDYATDPAYRARLNVPNLVKALPPGTIVGAAYAAFGNDTYTCVSRPICETRTQITQLYHFDDRSGVGAEIALASPCTYAAPGKPLFDLFPDWQFLGKPCPVFGAATHVGRAWSVFLTPFKPQTNGTYPFFAIYYGLQPGAGSA